MKFNDYPIRTEDSDKFEIKQHVPHSFWHKDGAYKASRKLLNQGLPDCKNAKFLTLTVARRDSEGNELYRGPADCYEKLKKEPAYLVQRLKYLKYRIIAYIVKLELHEDGWPHWHLVLWCKDYIPFEAINDKWSHGFTKINKVRKEQGLIYTLKYSFKGVDPPDWVKEYGRIQVCRKSQNFYASLKENGYKVEAFPTVKKFGSVKKKTPTTLRTIGERLERWRKMADVVICIQGKKTHHTFLLDYEFGYVHYVLCRNTKNRKYTLTSKTIQFESHTIYERHLHSISRRAREEQQRLAANGSDFTWGSNREYETGTEAA